MAYAELRAATEWHFSAVFDAEFLTDKSIRLPFAEDEYELQPIRPTEKSMVFERRGGA
jgi:hypothetical protein